MDEYYSQCGEVKWLVENLPIPDKGVFVDVGAHDGVTDSNTCYFERKLGWDGIVIEPDPRNWPSLIRDRSCRAFLGAIGSEPDAVFTASDDPQHSGIGRGGTPVHVPILPLWRVLAAYQIGPIDLLSVDTEGTEMDVLGTLDIDAHRPQIIIVEFYTTGAHFKPDRDNREAVMRWFSHRPYDMVHQACGNLIFARQHE